MQNNSRFDIEYGLKARVVISVAIGILFVRFLSGALIPQMQYISVLFPQTEIFYAWIYNSGIIQFLVSHHWTGAVFDIVMFCSPLVFIITLRRPFIVLFWLLALIYFIAYNIVTGHHYHGLIGILVITIPFFSKDEKRFNLLWEGARYYILYVFASAALWKILRGSAFYTDQLSNILKAQQLDLLLQNRDSVSAYIASYLIAHPHVGHVVLLGNVLLQLSFALGFFTKKYDRILLVLVVLFTIGNYFVMSIISVEILILAFTLLNWGKVKALADKYMPKHKATA